MFKCSLYLRMPRRACLAALMVAMVVVGGHGFALDVPENLGRGLRPLLSDYMARRQAGSGEWESARNALARSVHSQGDQNQRVLVDVLLDGRESLARVHQRARELGGDVTAEVGWYRKGLFSAWIPLKAVAQLAGAPGVSAVHLAPRRILRVGATTSQGTTVINSGTVNGLGYSGSGVTIGVISDSYNNDTSDSSDPGWTTAATDVSTGDLPGAANPQGYTSPVNVIQEASSLADNTDEGRGMAQIIHDVAPGAKLAFYTSGDTDGAMATGILKLQTTGSCKVICDDVGFFDEPMYSDGVIAQAIDTAAAAGVSYFSACGNDGNSGYQGTFTPINGASGQSLATSQGVNWSTVPSSETSAISEFHSFGTTSNGSPAVVQNIKTGKYQSLLIFEWDDPFDVVNNGVKGITSDFDILIFDSSGNYKSSLSGVDLNISTNEPLELPDNYMSGQTAYKICIVLTNRLNGTQPQLATHLRYIITNDYDSITGDFINLTNVSTVGHPYAAGCTGVAAYNYDASPDPGATGHAYTPVVEGYSSNGPVQIYFDTAGNRLATPITRKQPVIAAPDNVDTTFFPPSAKTPNPSDYDSDGFPNFAGTSAATPHAAAVAALLMNAAAVNNLGTLSPQEIQSILVDTTQGSSAQTPSSSLGTAGPVTLTDVGDMPDNNVFTVAYTGTSTGTAITNVTIDLSPIAQRFDISTTGTDTAGEAWTQVATTGTPAPVSSARSFPNAKSELSMAYTTFAPGTSESFIVGFVDTNTGKYGYNANLLGGVKFSAIVSGTTYTGTMAVPTGRTFNYKSGYGLIDANAALHLLLGH